MKLVRDLGESVPDTRQPKHSGKYAFKYMFVFVFVVLFSVSKILLF